MRLIFLIFSAMGLALAMGVVLSKNLVRAALCLVGFFFIVACQFVLLEAEFMAAMQVLVYIGAVAILLLFGIMLTRNILGDETTGASAITKAFGGLLSLGLLLVLFAGITNQKIRDPREGSIEYDYAKATGKPLADPGRTAWPDTASRLPVEKIASDDDDETPVAKKKLTSNQARKAAIDNMGLMVGTEMMTRFVIAFEVAGLLLTVALVGAVVLARHAGAEEPPPGKNRGKTAAGSVASLNGASSSSDPIPSEHAGGAAL